MTGFIVVVTKGLLVVVVVEVVVVDGLLELGKGATVNVEPLSGFDWLVGS